MSKTIWSSIIIEKKGICYIKRYKNWQVRQTFIIDTLDEGVETYGRTEREK